MKYYAVKEGRQKGIYYTWSDCQKQVIGHPCAVYKSFTSLDDANAFILGEATSTTSKNITFDENFDGAIAYVDGSYNVKTSEYSYGAIVLYQGSEFESYEKYDDNLKDMRNVAGEIRGAVFAMQFCLQNNIDKVKIFYDYEGISKWCLGEWKTNKQGTTDYKAFYDSIKDRLQVQFVKVKSHSGDKYNDIADILAKKALGLA